MGIRTDPGYDLWGQNCLKCFEAGKTPKKLYVTINGVQTTEWWDPIYGTLVNGTFICEQTDPCLWQGGLRGAWASVDLSSNYPLLWAITDKFTWYFRKEDTKPCVISYINEYQGEGWPFGGGTAHIFVRENLLFPK